MPLLAHLLVGSGVGVHFHSVEVGVRDDELSLTSIFLGFVPV